MRALDNAVMTCKAVSAPDSLPTLGQWHSAIGQCLAPCTTLEGINTLHSSENLRDVIIISLTTLKTGRHTFRFYVTHEACQLQRGDIVEYLASIIGPSLSSWMEWEKLFG